MSHSLLSAGNVVSCVRLDTMPVKLNIAEWGQPILRQVAQPVDWRDPDLSILINNMLYTVDQMKGVGLAAPQVFESKRVMIISSKPNTRYPNAPDLPVTVMLNPRLLNVSDEKTSDWEGCLSVPGLRGLVPRHEVITFEYMDTQGIMHQQQYTGFLARVFQHEYDHLQGQVYLDHLQCWPDDLMTETAWRQLVLTEHAQ